MVARLAGKTAKPDGLAAVGPGEVEAFLVDRPASDVPGVGPKTAEALSRFGIRTVRDLRALTRGELVRLFGRPGDALYDRARGRDTRPVCASEIPKTISRETTFHRETTDPSEIRGMLHYLVERAMKPVRELGLVARAVAARLRWADFKGDEGRTRLASPTDLEGPVFDAALAVLGRLHVRRVAVRLVGVTLSGLAAKDAGQASLLPDSGREDAERVGHGRLGAALAAAVDDVRGKFGFSAVMVGKSLDLLGRLRRDSNGYVLRTPCLTK
jgi:DNA polymerase-4